MQSYAPLTLKENMFINKKKQIKSKAPSLWRSLSWIERIIMFGGPILLVYVISKIIGG